MRRRPCEFPPRPRRPARRATDPRRRRFLENNKKISGTFPPELCAVVLTCQANVGNDLVAPCGSTGCCDFWDGAACPAVTAKCEDWCLTRSEPWNERCGWDSNACSGCDECGSSNSSSGKGKGASLIIIVPVVVAAVLLVAAILFLVHKRVVAARQHRRESMPTVGGEGEVQAEA